MPSVVSPAPLPWSRAALGATALFVVDGISAVLLSKLRDPAATAERTFQGVAYAVLGKDALAGGARTALFGVAMHAAVASTWVLVYFLAYWRLPALRRMAAGPIGLARVGAPYGAIIWLTMSLGIFPLTRIGSISPTSPAFVTNLVHHIVVVGPLVVLLLRSRG